MATKTSFAGFSPKRNARSPRRHLVAVLAFDGVVLGDLATPCELFGRVRTDDGRAPYEVRVCGTSSRVASELLTLHAPWRISSVDHADTVIVPGVDDVERPVPVAIQTAIRRALRRGARIASICSGAFVLAATGILDGLRATTHWLGAPELARRYPRVQVDPDVLYVDNGQVLTSAGAAAGLDLCLYLVRRDFGAEVAARAARIAVMPLERAGGQAQFIAYEPPARNGTAMGNLLAWIEQHLAEELTLSVLARRAAMSSRTFCRRFREQVGTTPAAWIARARVTHAQRLLESTNLSIETIASEVGLRSSTVLRDHFARLLGTSPNAYRRAFSAA
ncbi:helix-turn-helix domain-containing protein [Pendulispora brunnea]|uniref:Helix-turn-helix domain-containing protein n=1 Tax=Pendulispora brunnea TaxID=2905690 RepID=A0ABZ2KAJ5_9BACT